MGRYKYEQGQILKKEKKRTNIKGRADIKSG